jgi:hypothetical protein
MATYPTNTASTVTDTPRSDMPQKQPVSSGMASENRTTTTPVTTATVNPDSLITVDLHNPTRAQRVIYDGIPGSQRQIVINPNDTKHSVRLHRSIEKELRDRNRLKPNSDLIPSNPTEPSRAA